MLIINADDLGRSHEVTEAIMACFNNQIITSASAMVFMKDSKRAAELALSRGLETGLHINLTLPFDQGMVSGKLRSSQTAIASFLRSCRWAQAIYNPLIVNNIEYVFRTQYDEYMRLFDREPAKFDGHHHMHLCQNMVRAKLIPPGSWVRRNFSFEAGDKSVLNRTYRRFVDRRLLASYRCVDYFFSIEPLNDDKRHQKIMQIASTDRVELMVHPDQDIGFLFGTGFLRLIGPVPRATYSSLLHAEPSISWTSSLIK